MSMGDYYNPIEGTPFFDSDKTWNAFKRRPQMDQLEYLAKVLDMVRESCAPEPVVDVDTDGESKEEEC